MYPPIIAVVHTSADVWAFVWNFVVICLVITKTPKEIATYSIFIISLALFDMIAAVCDFMLKNRFIATLPSAVYMSAAPCRFISSEACHVFDDIMLHSYLYNLLVVVMSYIYRYYVIKTGRMEKGHLITMMFGCYSVAFIQMIVHINVPIDPHKIHERVQELLPDENITFEDYGFHGFIDLLGDIPNLYMCNSICDPCVPAVVVIICIRKKINNFLESKYLSPVSQKLNEQLMTALLFQSVVPMMYVYSIASFAIAFFIHDCKFLQYNKFLMMSLMPAMSPMFNIYFIKSYRETVRSWFNCARLRNHKVSSVNTVSAHGTLSTTVASATLSPNITNPPM